MASSKERLYVALEEDEDFDTLVTDTLKDLEWRLRKIEFAVTGEAGKTDGQRGEAQKQQQEDTANSSPVSVFSRINDLEQSLQKLSTKHSAILEVLKLVSDHPELFDDDSSKQLPEGLELSAAEAMVMAKADAYPTTASQLNTLKDSPMSHAEAFTNWIELWPKITIVQQRQYDMGVQKHLLKLRSELLMRRYQEVFVDAQGLVWDEWLMRINRGKRVLNRRDAILQEESK